MESLLTARQAADLGGLLAAVSRQWRLGREWRDAAGYWASQVEPGLDRDDAQTIARLLEEVADSLWLPGDLQQWARSWVTSLEGLTGGAACF